jgi:hypothetical protein
MTTKPTGDGPMPEPEQEFVIGNEFSEVRVSRVTTHNGIRLRIRDAKSGWQILLCPLELESLTWQNSELFTNLLATPYGPEEA